jgi:lipopolysaccharide transport system permease protein
MPEITATKVPVFFIRPSRGLVRINLRELWAYRDLLAILTWRDIKVRYKQTALGVAWAVLQPVLTMVVLSVFFGRLAKVPSDGIPYPIFAYCALLPWQLFAHAINESGNSLVANESLITKVYFPRLIIPLAAVLGGLADFAVAFVVLLGMMLWYGIVPGAAVALLPLFVLFALATALAIGLWLSALNVEYRDVRYTLPFITQFWLFVTPVAYPSSLVPEQVRVLYGFNPMAGVVEGFRWALLAKGQPDLLLMLASVAAVSVLLAGGLMYFRRMERTFADVV